MCTHVSNIICTHTIDFHGLFLALYVDGLGLLVFRLHVSHTRTASNPFAGLHIGALP